MGKTDVSLTIGGDATGLVAALSQAKEATLAASEQMKGAIEGAQAAFSKLQSVALAFTAVLAGGAAFKKVISDSQEWNMKAVELSRSLGITTEQASVYMAALQHLGINSDVLTGASVKMSKAIHTNGAAFDKLGIQTKDANGQFLSSGDVLKNTLLRLEEISNPIERNIAGVTLLGKGFAEMLPLMRLTAAGMAEAEKRARELGLIVGPEGAEQAEQYKLAMNDVGLVGKSLEMQIGKALIPTLSAVGAAFANQAAPMGEAFAKVLTFIAEIGGTVWFALQRIAQTIGAVGAAAAAVLHGDFSAAKSIMADLGGQLHALDKEYEAFEERLNHPPKPAKSAAPDIGGQGIDDLLQKPSKGPDVRLQGWKDSLEQIKQAEGEFRKADLQADVTYWSQKLASITTSSNADKALRLKINAEIYALKQKEISQDKALDEEAAQQRKAIGLLELQNKREQLKLQLDEGVITKARELAGERQLEDQKFAIEQTALQGRLQLVQADKLARQKIMDELELLELHHQNALTQIDTQAAKAQMGSWNTLFHGMSSGFSQVLSGLVTGSKSIGSAIGGLFRSMASAVGDALSSITSKLIEQHLMAMLLNKKEVASNSAVAATGAAKSAAQIPFIGWLLAIGAAAAVFGAMSSYSAEGGFDVPGSLAPMTKLHPKEMVLPAQYADVIRGLAGGPGGSGGAGGDVHQHTWNVNAIDARSFDQFLRTGGGRAIAAEMSRQYSMFNSNLRGKA